MLTYRSLSLAEAQIMLDAAQRKCEEMGVAEVLCVADPAGFPIALGSWWGLLVLAAILPVLLWRLFDEEAFLAKHLPGYFEYQAKVKHRLVPFVW